MLTALLTRFAWQLPLDPRSRLLWWLGRREGELAYEVVDALVKPGDIVLDVGANWGRYSARFARLVGPSGRVHSFEPDPANCETIAAIGRKTRNVQVHCGGLSDAEGEAVLYVPVEGGRRMTALASIEPPDGPCEEQRMRLWALDDVLDQTVDPDFVKIDVEGHEMAVLRGARRTLERSRPGLLVEIEQRHGADVPATVDFLRELGFDAWFVAQDGLRSFSEFDVQRHQVDPLQRGEDGHAAGYVNDFLFIPAGSSPPAVGA